MNIKAAKSQALIFIKSDKLTDDAKKACSILHIDPNMLIPKAKETFKEDGVEASIAEIRFYHYEDKRKCLIQEVEQFIKSGGMNATSNAFNRSGLTGMEFRKTRMTHSPYLISDKPDIPLRSPLGEESKSKRKAAKDIFEREKWEKVMQNKLKLQLEEEK